MMLMRNQLKLAASAIAVSMCLCSQPAHAQTQPPASSQPPQDPVVPVEQSTEAPQPVPGDASPLVGNENVAVPTDPAQPATQEGAEIVVTGTSIRGVAPVGANLVTVGREAIEDTGAVNITQILQTVPSITQRQAGSAPSGGAASDNSNYSPSIHNLGASASNATLVLIDGHRIPLGGVNHAQPDPGLVPPIAIERVEVLAEGASSTYGSDAVAGVVNFITRKRFKGVQAQGQVGFGNDVRNYSAGVLLGTEWDTGSVYVAGGFSRIGAQSWTSRDYFDPDHRDEGGTNFLSFNCSPATIQPAGSSGIYLTPTSTSTVANITANATCDTNFGNRTPEETRYNIMVRIAQDIGDRLRVGADLMYLDRSTILEVSRGTLNATAFGAGAQANPFYVNPPGVTATSQTVRWSADELLGPGAHNDVKAEVWAATATAEYRLTDSLRVTALGLIGHDRTNSMQVGLLCGSCANLALNGTTNSAGNLTQASIPGTNIIVQTLPLTAANALDVWNPAATNRTSEAVRARLRDSRFIRISENLMKQARIGLDGSLFALPGGNLRFAIGGELFSYSLNTSVDRPNNTGPSSIANSSTYFPLSRNVKSAYAELLVPLVSEEMGVPGVRKLEVNISGRYDDYSDVGSTKNPKFAASWEPFHGLEIRGNWSKSFVAPSVRSLGDENGLYNDSGYAGFNPNLSVPIAAYPNIVNIPGIQCSATHCQIGGTIQGIQVTSGNPNLEPQRGTTWSIGADFTPQFLRGFRASATWFHNKFRGGVTSPSLSPVVNTAALNQLLTFYPNGATQAEILAATDNGLIPQTGAIPSRVFFINNFRQQNVLNLDVSGLDISVNYILRAGPAGIFTAGVNVTRFLKFDQNFGGGATFDVLNTTGFNTTFPSIRTKGRANIGWELDAFSADVFANYVGSYKNWSGSTVTPVTVVNGIPTGGGDKVRSDLTFDLHLAYKLSRQGGWLGDSQVYVDVANVFDRDPPFYNAAQGYDPYSGNPAGRVVSLGFRSKF